MNELDKRLFFKDKKTSPITVKIGGNFSFKNLSKEIKEKVLNQLAKKDEVMALGIKGILPGIKIDGKQVTKDNIKDFEKKVEVVKLIDKIEQPIEVKVEPKVKVTKVKKKIK